MALNFSCASSLRLRRFGWHRGWWWHVFVPSRIMALPPTETSTSLSWHRNDKLCHIPTIGLPSISLIVKKLLKSSTVHFSDDFFPSANELGPPRFSRSISVSLNNNDDTRRSKEKEETRNWVGGIERGTRRKCFQVSFYQTTISPATEHWSVGRSVVMGQVIEVNLLDCTDVVVREDTIKLLLRSDKMILRWASPIIS